MGKSKLSLSFQISERSACSGGSFYTIILFICLIYGLTMFISVPNLEARMLRCENKYGKVIYSNGYCPPGYHNVSLRKELRREREKAIQRNKRYIQRKLAAAMCEDECKVYKYVVNEPCFISCMAQAGLPIIDIEIELEYLRIKNYLGLDLDP